MSNQTLLERVHPNLQIEKMDLGIFEKVPSMMLLYNIVKPGDGTGAGYVGIKDSKNTYEFGSKVFYVDDYLKSLPRGPEGLKCGIINSFEVDTNVEKVYNQIGKSLMSDKETEIKFNPEDYDYEKLPRKMKAIFQAYLQIRILETERKNNVSPLEVFLLDTIDMNRKRYRGRFDLERNIQELCQWYKFSESKLRSGVQRRRQCRRWAKKDFEDNNGKFLSKYQMYTKKQK